MPGQVREADLSDQYEAACESACSEAESAAAEALDLPLPSYFRSRSHSYLRAIQAGCSQEEDSVSLQSLSPPPSTGSLSNSRTLPSEYGHGEGLIFLFVLFARRLWEPYLVGQPGGMLGSNAQRAGRTEVLGLYFPPVGELERKPSGRSRLLVGGFGRRLEPMGSLVASWLRGATC